MSIGDFLYFADFYHLADDFSYSVTFLDAALTLNVLSSAPGLLIVFDKVDSMLLFSLFPLRLCGTQCFYG